MEESADVVAIFGKDLMFCGFVLLLLLLLLLALFLFPSRFSQSFLFFLFLFFFFWVICALNQVWGQLTR